MNQYKEIAQKLKVEGYRFEMSEYLGQGWKLGMSVVGYFILFALLSFAISMAAGMVPLIGPLANSIFLRPVLSAGLILFLNHKYQTGESNFALVFEGFKNMGQIILANFLIMLFVMLAFIPVAIGLFQFISFEMISAMMNNDVATLQSIVQDMTGALAGLFIYVFLSLVLMMIAMVLFLFTMYFVVLGKLNAIDAIKASMSVVKKKFFSYIALFIVLGLINMLGMLALVVGVIFTMSMTVGALYIAFNQIVMSQVDEDVDVLITEDDILDA